MLAADHAGVLAGLDQRALAGERLLPIDGRDDRALLVLELVEQRIVIGEDDGDNGQVVLLGKLEVALVAARYGHDGAGSVIGDDVVGDPYRHLGAGDRVENITVREGAVLLKGALGALDGRDMLSALDHLADGLLVLGSLDKLHQALVFGGEQEEGVAEQGVRTGGEDGDLALVAGDGLAVLIAKGKVYLGALGTADPVGLHLLDALGPAGKLIQVIEELLRVLGDLDVPLLEVALLHLGVAAPAAALGHLLVGEHGLALGTPVDRVLLAVDQPALPELLEDPLAPAVVVRAAGLDQAVHVVGEAHALHGGERLVHVLVGPRSSLGVVLDGRVLGGQAEGVKADGMQHVKAAHTRLARHGIADGVVARMAHMQVARRIREHLEDVLLGLRGIGVHGEEVLLLPGLHPLGLNCLRIVGRDLPRRAVGIAMLVAIAHAWLLSIKRSETPVASHR